MYLRGDLLRGDVVIPPPTRNADLELPNDAQQLHAATPTDDQDKKEKLKRLIEAKKLLSSRSLHAAAAAANATTTPSTTSDNEQGEPSSSSSASSEANNNQSVTSSSSSNQTPMGISPSKPGRAGPFSGQASLTVARRQQFLREIAAQKKERKKDMRGARE